MKVNMLWYPKCSTCQKAKAFLEEKGVEIRELRDIKLQNPSGDEIRSWKEKGNLPLKKFFNTSGKKYRELNLKERINDLSPQEMAEILASDGMLIKRPVLTDGKKVTVGFKEETYESVWK